MARCAVEGMFGLKNCFSHEVAGVIVLEPVEHAGAFLAWGDKPDRTHLGQMLRDRCGGLVDNVGEVVDRQFALAQGQDDAHARGVGEHGEDFNRKLDELAVRIPAAYLYTCIHAHIMAYPKPWRHRLADPCVNALSGLSGPPVDGRF